MVCAQLWALCAGGCWYPLKEASIKSINREKQGVSFLLCCRLLGFKLLTIKYAHVLHTCLSISKWQASYPWLRYAAFFGCRNCCGMKSSIKIGEEPTGFLMRMDEDGLFQRSVWGMLGASMLCLPVPCPGANADGRRIEGRIPKKAVSGCVKPSQCLTPRSCFPWQPIGFTVLSKFTFFHLCFISQKCK